MARRGHIGPKRHNGSPTRLGVRVDDGPGCAGWLALAVLLAVLLVAAEAAVMTLMPR